MLPVGVGQWDFQIAYPSGFLDFYFCDKCFHINVSFLSFFFIEDSKDTHFDVFPSSPGFFSVKNPGGGMFSDRTEELDEGDAVFFGHFAEGFLGGFRFASVP
jgi:hypothetical protein